MTVDQVTKIGTWAIDKCTIPQLLWLLDNYDSVGNDPSSWEIHVEVHGGKWLR